jgi:agmatine deiminase
MHALHTSTPRVDGFHMPAEWTRHAKTWMTWPTRPDSWPFAAKPAQLAFSAVAAAISRFEPVMMCTTAPALEAARRTMPDAVTLVTIETDDAWMRDCGPTFVVNDAGEVRAVDWEFNAWGGLYSPCDRDDAIPQRICEREGIGRYRAPLVLEGGSIHVDGEGTVLTTEECLLNANRNPELSREQIESHLREFLGVDVVVWLWRGLDPEVTSGHIDDLACFVRPGVVALAWTDDPEDWRHEVVADAYRRLSETRDARGRRLQVHKIPLPAEVVVSKEEVDSLALVEGVVAWEPGMRQPANYINHYICNGGVILPVYGDPLDGVAQELIAGLYPGRAVVPVMSRDVVAVGGVIHCITQQQPAGKR